MTTTTTVDEKSHLNHSLHLKVKTLNKTEVKLDYFSLSSGPWTSNTSGAQSMDRSEGSSPWELQIRECGNESCIIYLKEKKKLIEKRDLIWL